MIFCHNIRERSSWRNGNLYMSSPMQELANARKKHNRFKMKCIVPDKQGVLCGKDPIKSHSIQHNGILSCLAENGIVYCLGETTKGDEIFEYDLKDRGITQEASVFKCLCKEHDDTLFADIEKRIFCKEPKQCFQYALKALLHSYWSKCNDVGITEKYKGKVQIAQQISEDQRAYGDELNDFWKIYHTEQYQELLSYIVTINREINSAVSTSINMCRKLDGSFLGKENENYPLLHISAFPSKEKSYLLISALKKNEIYFKSFMQQFLMLSEDAILKRFNIIFPLLAKNIMISPRVVNKITSQEKQQLLLIFRLETMSLYYQRGVNINSWADQVSYNIWG